MTRMQTSMEGRTALVTGGSSGIGFAIAQAFIVAGGSVMIAARQRERLKASAAELGPRAAWTTADAGRPADAERVVGECIERFGSLDVLVNNAGVNLYFGNLVDAPLDAWDATQEMNLRGPLAWSQAAWHGWMHHADDAAIINVASLAGLKTSMGIGIYGVMKAALVHLTKQLAAEMAPRVRVNALAPAVVEDTEFARPLWEGERGQAIARSYPLGRLGRPADVADAALYLAGARWVTGHTMVLDGGALVGLPGATVQPQPG
jgi:NAD(P)-dependent dehydrogenase (short-subunit alcohol dehydrogenase family)